MALGVDMGVAIWVVAAGWAPLLSSLFELQAARPSSAKAASPATAYDGRVRTFIGLSSCR
jgi:hypothetical protein